MCRYWWPPAALSLRRSGRSRFSTALISKTRFGKPERIATMLIRINRARRRLTTIVALLLATAWLLPSSIVLAQAPAPAAAASPAAPPSVPITNADIKGISGPSAADLAKGDPGGIITGTVNDLVISDSKAGLTIADIANN